MKTRIVFLIVITFWVAAVANAQASKEVLVFGQKIQYVEAGSGPTVILLHGLGGSSQAWGPNTSALAEKYRVIVPDQIGFGKSDKPLVNYRIRTYVDFLDQFCKQLKIERATLVGSSMGGWIAAMFTAGAWTAKPAGQSASVQNLNAVRRRVFIQDVGRFRQHPREDPALVPEPG